MTESESDRLIEGLYAYVGEHAGVDRATIVRVLQAESDYWSAIVNAIYVEPDDES